MRVKRLVGFDVGHVLAHTLVHSADICNSNLYLKMEEAQWSLLGLLSCLGGSISPSRMVMGRCAWSLREEARVITRLASAAQYRAAGRQV
eukprot:1157550-Pelagomonas_calceolata.AAC.9